MVAEIRSFLFVLNDGPYGGERPHNALRHAMNLAKSQGVRLRVFLAGDGVQGGRKGQRTPEGYYSMERMIKSLAKRWEVAT